MLRSFTILNSLSFQNGKIPMCETLNPLSCPQKQKEFCIEILRIVVYQVMYLPPYWGVSFELFTVLNIYTSHNGKLTMSVQPSRLIFSSFFPLQSMRQSFEHCACFIRCYAWTDAIRVSISGILCGKSVNSFWTLSPPESGNSYICSALKILFFTLPPRSSSGQSFF